MTITNPVESPPPRVWPPGGLPRLPGSAPPGGHALVEAALAWRHLRPVGWQTGTADLSPHPPIALTDHEPLADRMVLIIAGLTWAYVRPAGWRVPHRLEVCVPHREYRRVLRALGAGWRHCRRQFAPGTPRAADPGAAVAMWRMALLLYPTEPSGGAVRIRTAVPFAAEMLYEAAAVLRIAASLERVRRTQSVLVSHPGQVRRLLALTRAERDPALLPDPGRGR